MAEKQRGIIQIESTGLQSLSQVSNMVTGLNQGLELVGRLMGVVTKATKEFVATGSQFEQFNVQFETLLGSVDAAETRMRSLFNFATTTPFELPDVVSAAKSLEAYGIFSDRTLRAAGDAASAFGKDFNETALAIAGASTGEMERLKQFGITSMHITEQLGHAMVRDTKEGLEEITQAVVELFEKKAGGGMLRMSQTMEGIISNLSDAWTRFTKLVADAGPFQTVKDILGSVLQTVNQLFDQGQAERAAELVGKALSEALWTAAIAMADTAANVYDMVLAVNKIMGPLFGRGPGARGDVPETDLDRLAAERRAAGNPFAGVAQDLRTRRDGTDGSQAGQAQPTNPFYVPGGFAGPYWPGDQGTPAAAATGYGGPINELGRHGYGLDPRGMDMSGRGEEESGLFGFSEEAYAEEIELISGYESAVMEMQDRIAGGWDKYYSNVGKLGSKWAKQEKVNLKDLQTAIGQGAREQIAAFADVYLTKAKTRAAFEAAEALAAVARYDFASAAKHGAAAAGFAALAVAGSIASSYFVEKGYSGGQGSGEAASGASASGESTGTRNISRTVGVTAQTITNNVYVNHYAPVAYAPGGWKQVIDEEIIPAIEEAFEFARVG